MQMHGNLEGFPVDSALFWVRSYNDPCSNVNKGVVSKMFALLVLF